MCWVDFDFDRSAFNSVELNFNGTPMLDFLNFNLVNSSLFIFVLILAKAVFLENFLGKRTMVRRVPFSLPVGLARIQLNNLLHFFFSPCESHLGSWGFRLELETVSIKGFYCRRLAFFDSVAVILNCLHRQSFFMSIFFDKLRIRHLINKLLLQTPRNIIRTQKWMKKNLLKFNPLTGLEFKNIVDQQLGLLGNFDRVPPHLELILTLFDPLISLITSLRLKRRKPQQTGKAAYSQTYVKTPTAQRSTS